MSFEELESLVILQLKMWTNEKPLRSVLKMPGKHASESIYENLSNFDFGCIFKQSRLAILSFSPIRSPKTFKLRLESSEIDLCTNTLPFETHMLKPKYLSFKMVTQNFLE